jgi:hypothetical protein
VLCWGLLTVVAVLASLTVVRLLEDPAAPSAARADKSPQQVALSELRGWDERRATAYSRGDVAALRALYAEGSEAGARDARLLRSYVGRGLAVDGVHQQVLELEVLDAAPQRLDVRVTDRLAGATVDLGRREVALPDDRPSTNDVVLVRQQGTWLVWSVDPVSSG